MSDEKNQRRDEVLKRMLKTPPKPHKPEKGENTEEQDAASEDVPKPGQ